MSTPETKTYTVFVRSADDRGTTWIGVVQALGTLDASTKGEEACAADWGVPVDDVVAIGLAEGEVNILWWREE